MTIIPENPPRLVPYPDPVIGVEPTEMLNSGRDKLGKGEMGNNTFYTYCKVHIAGVNFQACLFISQVSITFFLTSLSHLSLVLSPRPSVPAPNPSLANLTTPPPRPPLAPATPPAASSSFPSTTRP